MEKFKKIVIKLFFPPIWVTLLFIMLAVGAMLYSLTTFGSEHFVTYISYALSAYATTILCCKIPDIIRLIRKIRKENKVVVRLESDTHFRVSISLFCALVINVAYAAFQFSLGVYHHTSWYYSLAGYYILLTIMRLYLLFGVHGKEREISILKEWRRYRVCGIILAVMTLALATIVFYITFQNRTFVHHEITTIAIASYTFGSFTVAIINALKYRKYDSPVFSASKFISLAAASVSMLTLETAMLTAFGSENEGNFRQIMTGTTGAAVCIFVFCMAIYMIWRSTRRIKEIK